MAETKPFTTAFIPTTGGWYAAFHNPGYNNYGPLLRPVAFWNVSNWSLVVGYVAVNKSLVAADSVEGFITYVANNDAVRLRALEAYVKANPVPGSANDWEEYPR